MSKIAGHRGGDNDSRLSRLEAVVEGLANDLRSLTADVKSLASGVEHYVRKSAHTDWRALAAWAGVTLSAAAIGGGLIAYAIRAEVRYVSEKHDRDVEWLRVEMGLRDQLVAARVDSIERHVLGEPRLSGDDWERYIRPWLVDRIEAAQAGTRGEEGGS